MNTREWVLAKNATLPQQWNVCETALCNSCRNNLYPYKEADGTLVFQEAHPVQCECTVKEFQLALMQARKDERGYNTNWSIASDDDKIAPLAAICFVRSLVSLCDTGATALDYHLKVKNLSILLQTVNQMVTSTGLPSKPRQQVPIITYASKTDNISQVLPLR